MSISNGTRDTTLISINVGSTKLLVVNSGTLVVTPNHPQNTEPGIATLSTDAEAAVVIATFLTKN